MDWQALGLTVRLAIWTTWILAIIGLPISYWLANSRAKWKFLVEGLIALPIVLPPTVLGFYLLLAIGPKSPVGRAYELMTGGILPFSFYGLLLGSVLYSLPFAVQPFTSGLIGVNQSLIEASYCLGVSRMSTFFRLILPLCLPSLFTGLILSFAHTLGEFGVVLMIGGGIQGETRTLSVSIFDDVQSMNYESAARTSAVLLFVSFIILTLVSILKKKSNRSW